jgi:uncharacterized glyoxalase superfamily protein PhnB
MTQVIPMLSYEDVGAAIDWLGTAFGFKEVERYEDDDGRVTHGVLSHDGAELHVGWPGPAYQSPKRHVETCGAAREWLNVPWIVNGVLLYVDDLDAHYERAREAGARIIREREEQPYGRLYSAEDIEGQRWMVMTPS